MHYSLRPNLSYCMIDGHPIFLDIDEDRYFRLDGPLEDAFRAYVNAGVGHGPCMDALVDRAILVPGSLPDHRSNRISLPARSSIELAAGSGPVGIAAILQVFAIVWRMRSQLGVRALKEVLHDLARYRDERRLPAAPSESHEARTLEAASLFTRARLYVPFDTCCLLDSLALTKYLAGQGVPANIVFGVTDAPFSAHCWVQVGDLVLNDTVGNTMAYMPIRKI
jgi:hypothetical protein